MKSYETNNMSNDISKVSFYVVPEDRVEQRIDNFLITRLKVPKSHVYRIIRKGQVRVNKGRIKPDYRLKQGDSVRIPPVQLTQKPNDNKHKVLGTKTLHKSILARILFEDKKLIVINKPAGLAVHGGSGIHYGLIEQLRLAMPNELALELVHRLDRETSGCLMISKTRSLLRSLHTDLRERQLSKEYWTLVKGHWGKKNQTADFPLKKNQLSSGERKVFVDTEMGKSAKTQFTLIQQFPNCALVKARPITGRTHQIRVHAKALGHPIAGDQKYGCPTFNRLLKQKGLKRLFLHARALTLNLSYTQDLLNIEAPLDNELKDLLEILSLNNVKY
jgi:23S rRNA pseudouridine955/2504/2580 synthase